ncbi:MAG: 4-(cytidine 5'-diphospho)-2-C-methyl-D-erythritol kinase [Candidatus Hydrogenedens sp.]
MPALMKVRTNAKINLYLDVIGKYPDGFHKIESIFQTVTLSDTLTFFEMPRGVCVTTNDTLLPTDDRNIVYKTVEKVKDITGIEKGIHVHIQKHIPICAGLGGGSANSAGTLYAVNKLWNLGLSESNLMDIAKGLGSDVPYFFKGGTQSVTGKGENINALIPISDIWVVLIHPPLSLSTAKVYQHPALSIRPSHVVAIKYSIRFRKVIYALRKRNWKKVIYNRLELPAFCIYPELYELKLKIKKMGFPYVGMTGSGSTFFVIVESKKQGKELIRKLNWKTHLVKTTAMAIEEI